MNYKGFMTLPREPIFKSALRSLCNALAVVLGVFVAIFLVMSTLSILSPPAILPEKCDVAIAPDAHGKQDLLHSHCPAVLRIDIRGVIGIGELTTENIQSILLDSRIDFLKKNRVKAIFLYVNTPGGAADDSAGIYQALMDYKAKYNTPIYAFVDGLCASGGMYICSAADQIYATPSSVIGSVGVRIDPSFNVYKLMEKVGVESKTITQGKDKDMLNPFRPWTPGEDTSLVNITKSLYEQFVTAVTTGRKELSKEKLIEEYGAQVFDAVTSKKFGYIDVDNANYFQTMQALVEAAKIDKEDYQVVQLSIAKTFFAELAKNHFSLLSGKIHHTFQIGPYMTSELTGKFLYLYEPAQ
jgi:signal peptide peptidase SppA